MTYGKNGFYRAIDPKVERQEQLIRAANRAERLEREVHKLRLKNSELAEFIYDNLRTEYRA